MEAASDDGNSTWQFRLPTTNDSKILKHQLADTVTVHRILKNGVYFTTKELRQFSTKQQVLRAEYDRQVVLDATAAYCNVLERTSEAVSHLNVLTALTISAAYSPHGYCRTIMTDSDNDDGAGILASNSKTPSIYPQ